MIPCFKDVCTKRCSKDHYAGKPAKKSLHAVAVYKSSNRLSTTRELTLLDQGVQGGTVKLWDRRTQGTWRPAGVPSTFQNSVGEWSDWAATLNSEPGTEQGTFRSTSRSSIALPPPLPATSSAGVQVGSMSAQVCSACLCMMVTAGCALRARWRDVFHLRQNVCRGGSLHTLSASAPVTALPQQHQLQYHRLCQCQCQCQCQHKRP
jgi:hypothetical protein